MDLSFVDIFGNMFSGQILIRFCSFFFNFALLRVVDPSILGFFNVRMNLFYNTIGFLSREPIRRFCLGSEITGRELLRYSTFSLIICYFTTIGCSCIWYLSWQYFNSELKLANLAHFLVLGAYILSIFMEIAIEPIIIKELKSGSTKLYVRNNSIMMFTQKSLTFVSVCISENPLISFSLSQIAGSVIYMLLFINPSKLIKIYYHTFSDIFHRSGFELDHLRLLRTFILHSFLKQILNDGANFLMTFSNLITLEEQAIYDAIERLGSLAVRLILQPLEESSAIYFGINMKHGQGKVPPQVFDTFMLLFRLILIIGIFLFIFGSTYSEMAAYLYGGQLFIDRKAGKLLLCYSIYLPVIAVNGLSECFAMSIFDTKQLFYHACFFLFSMVVHLTLSYVFCKFFNAIGFIIANILNYLIRILFNWRFIRDALKIYPKSFWTQIILNPTFLMSICTTWIILIISSVCLNYLFHFSVGIAMMAINVSVFYKYEYPNFRELKLKRN